MSYESNFIKKLDYKVYDITKDILYNNDEDSKSHVVIVDIDEKSLSALGQWPWPRVMLAQLLDNLNKHNPASIGLDIMFPEKDRTSPIEILSFYKKFFRIDANITGLREELYNNDLLFSQAIKNTESVLSVYLSNSSRIGTHYSKINGVDLDLEEVSLENSEYILHNSSLLYTDLSTFGFINTSIDEDGILRRMPLFRTYNDIKVPSLALAILSNINSKIEYIPDNKIEILDHEISMGKNSNVLLNYYDENWYKKVSVLDVLSNKVAHELTGKILIVGSSAVALHDVVMGADGKAMAGVKVHATLMDNILNNELLVQPEKYKLVNVFISFLLIGMLMVLLYIERNMSVIMIFIGANILSLYIAMLTINNGIYISLGYFTLPFLLHFFAISTFEMIFEMFERRRFILELNKSHIALLDSMVHVAEVHDIETGEHIVRTKEYVKVLGTHLHNNNVYKDELSKMKLEIIYRTAPLHDLGKVGISDAILKKPGRLTDMEFEVMKTHPMLGVHIINNAINSYSENEFFLTGRNIAHYHHEKWDGTGYPEGLKGEDIPIEARLMAVADVYDALINRRVYKEAFSYEEAIRIIIDGKAKHFDPLMVEAFIECQDQFRKIAELYADDNFNV